MSRMGNLTYMDTKIISGTTQRGVFNISSLGLVQKYHLVTYNSQYENEFVVHISQRPTFKMNKDGIFYHYMMHRLKKNMHIMVNDSRYPIP